jgi:site-specific DNA-methyltransferase (adenine-specific)
MAEAYRVLKQDRVAVMFYEWTKVDAFFDAWRSAGFQPVGHLVFRKTYSSKSRFLRYQHEQAYLLAKGRPPLLRLRSWLRAAKSANSGML